MSDSFNILPINVKPPFDVFLEKLSIKKNGLAAQLMQDIYYQFFVNSKDLKEEYQKYYTVEYVTLNHYLEMRYNLFLSEEDLSKNYIIRFSNSSQITDPAYENNYYDRIIELLQKMEATDEN